nr:MAG: hypothetical protein [Bacteriophage sp.]
MKEMNVTESVEKLIVTLANGITTDLENGNARPESTAVVVMALASLVEAITPADLSKIVKDQQEKIESLKEALITGKKNDYVS